MGPVICPLVDKIQVMGRCTCNGVDLLTGKDAGYELLIDQRFPMGPDGQGSVFIGLSNSFRITSKVPNGPSDGMASDGRVMNVNWLVLFLVFFIILL